MRCVIDTSIDGTNFTQIKKASGEEEPSEANDPRFALNWVDFGSTIKAIFRLGSEKKIKYFQCAHEL